MSISRLLQIKTIYLVKKDGDLNVVGLGVGKYEYNRSGLPYGVHLTNPYWGSQIELMEVIRLALQKIIHIEIEKYSLDQAVYVYDKLRQAQINASRTLPLVFSSPTGFLDTHLYVRQFKSLTFF